MTPASWSARAGLQDGLALRLADGGMGEVGALELARDHVFRQAGEIAKQRLDGFRIGQGFGPGALIWRR